MRSNDELKVMLIIAIMIIIGLLWFIADRGNKGDVAPCSRDYVERYGDRECQELQQDIEKNSDHHYCGTRPGC